MVNLPVTDRTFRRGFLNGQGEIQVTVPQALAGMFSEGAPLPDGVRNLGIAEANASSPSLKFGGGGPLVCTTTFSASASAGIEVLHAGESSEFLTKYTPDYAVPDDRIALRLFLAAKGELAADAALPAIPGLAFGVKAGARVGYSRIVAMPSTTPVRAALLDVLGDVRLPQHRGRPQDIPDSGEIVVLEHGGFLALNAGLTWGYSLTATESLDVGGIEATVEYALRLKAGLSLGYTLAGDFAIVLRAGARPGWVRLSVHKSRETAFSFAAGFAANGQIKADLAAETLDDILTAFIGADVRHAVTVFDRVRSVESLEDLEAKVGRLLIDSVRTLAHRWVGAALDQATVADFVRVLGEVVAAYKDIDRRVLDLYEDYLRLAKLDVLRDALRRITELSSKEATASVGDSEVFAVLRHLAGHEIFTIAERSRAFAEAQDLAEQALAFLDGSRVKDLIDQLQKDFRLDVIFGHLEALSSTDGLLATVDRRIQGVVERIVGRSFEEIRRSDADRAFKEIQTTIANIDAFRSAFITKLEKVLDQSVSMEINYAYTRATSDKALVDLEFDVRDARGARLFDLAASGRMADVMADANLAVVRVHEAALTHQLSRSSHLQVNVIGWSLGRLVELVSETRISLEEEQDGGLVQLLATTASLKQRRESGRSAKEISQTVFMLTLAGEVDRQPSSDADLKRRRYLVNTLNHMSAAYESLVIDEQTTLTEMYQYLALARWLELIPPAPDDPAPLPVLAKPDEIPSIDAFIRALTAEFPDGLGKVTMRYVVRYDDDTLREAFTATSGSDLERRVSESCRRIIGGHLITPRKNPILAAQGVAFADSGLRAAFETDGRNAVGGRSWTVTLPSWLGRPVGGRKVRLEANAGAETLASAFVLERDFCRAMRQLDLLVDDARAQQKGRVAVRDLSAASEKMLAAASGLEGFFGVNVLFGVMDDLVQQGRQGRGRRESSLILDIESPGHPKVTKFLMAGRE